MCVLGIPTEESPKFHFAFYPDVKTKLVREFTIDPQSKTLAEDIAELQSCLADAKKSHQDSDEPAKLEAAIMEFAKLLKQRAELVLRIFSWKILVI